MEIKRLDGRTCDQVRPVKIFFDALGYADSSVLFELGNTKVLASVILQQNVPHFLRGQKVGWLSAEYAMLPCATHQRTLRESSQGNRNPRSVEISRLIGRCLRTCVNLEELGERTILIDCDVLQADGSTRVAAITAASLALEQAVLRWHTKRIIGKNIFTSAIAAVSVGMINGTPRLDLCYEEDSSADADFNIVMTKSGDIVEIQGTAEKIAVNWKNFEQLRDLANKGITDLFAYFSEKTEPPQEPSVQKTQLFSLGNRIQNQR